jgi:hypothetical protein
VELFSNVGGSGDNFTDTVLDDQATTWITAGTAPFTGKFQPVASLAAFNDLEVDGTWTLEIVDDTKGDSGTLNSWSIEVTAYVPKPNQAPVAGDDSANTDEDIGITIDVLSNDSDADGDPIVISSVTEPVSGTAVENNDGTITYTPDANFNGTDSFTYTIDDGNGGTDTATVTVTVNPVADPPDAVDDAESTTVDTVVTIDVLANDSDPDGDALAVIDVTAPVNGTAEAVDSDADGVLDSVTYTPASDFIGTDSFTYTVSDGNGGTATATVTVDVTGPNSGTALYVSAIDFESKAGGKFQQAVVTIRCDSNLSGVGNDGDDVVAGVEITVLFGGQTFTGTTDASGVFRTDWVKDLSADDAYANVVGLVLDGYDWDPLSLLNMEDDSDEDGWPDDAP